MKMRFVLLILVALVLVWKFVLFPTKIDFSDRTKVLQGLALASPYKVIITESWKANGQYPPKEYWLSENPTPAGTLENTLVKSIIVGEESPGSISIYYTRRDDTGVTADIEGKTIILTPNSQSGELVWKCKSTVPIDLLPKACR